MKKLLTLFAFALAYTGLSAQWTYTSGDFPAIGSQQYYSIADTTGFSAGAAGSGQTWDFSGLTSTSTTTWTMKTPSSAPANANFPSATHALVNSGNDYRYFQVTNDTVFLVGEKSIASTPCRYTDSAGVMAFPFSMGNSFTDSMYAVYPDGFISSVSRSAEVFTEFDGDGTLITPFGSYSNIIRIHRSYSYQDSSWTGVADGVMSIEEYEWYEQGRPFPVVYYKDQVVSINGGNPQVTRTLLFADSNLVTMDPVIDRGFQVDLLPNPTDASAFMALELTESFPVSIEVITLNGQSVNKMDMGNIPAGTHRINLNAETLAPGIYLIKAQIGTEFTTRKLVIR